MLRNYNINSIIEKGMIRSVSFGLTRLLLAGLFSLLLVSADYASIVEIPTEAKDALASGNARDLSKHFNQTIEIEINGSDGFYSKYQAEQIMREFFIKNKPNGFTVVFEGGKDVSKYAIGKLSTGNGTYRVNFLIKASVIHQIRFEKE